MRMQVRLPTITNFPVFWAVACAGTYRLNHVWYRHMPHTLHRLPLPASLCAVHAKLVGTGSIMYFALGNSPEIHFLFLPTSSAPPRCLTVPYSYLPIPRR